MTLTRRNILFLLFAFSGFTGLIYEAIWTHYLKLFLGHAAYSQVLVLAVFMGGIALGSWICGRYSTQWKNLIIVYAFVEAMIGFSALIFHDMFDLAMKLAYERIMPQLFSGLALGAFKWVLSALLILPQTILLGMTFPLMAAGIVRRFPDDSGDSISMLYFLNSIGGALGVLTSGYFLIRLVGLPGTIRAAGLINISLGICVWLLIRGLSVESRGPGPTRDLGHPTADTGYRILLIASLVTGTASFIYEIGWIRMLSLVLGSSTHSFELMLAVFIFGLALGGLWMRRRIGRIADTLRFLVTVQIIMGCCALFSLVQYGSTFAIMEWLMKVLPVTEKGYALFSLASGVIALYIMFPTAFCAGMTLPLLTFSLIRGGHGERSIGVVYAANTIGAILGVVFAIHVGMPLLGLKGLMMTGAGLDIVLGVALLWSTRVKFRSGLMRPAVTAACIVAMMVIGLFVKLDAFKMGSGVYRYGTLISRDDSKLIYHKDGKTATVSSFLSAGVLDIRMNGKSDAGIQTDPSLPAGADEATMVLLAAIPLSLNPQAKTAANIGFGSGLTTSTLLMDDSLDEVDTIEIEPVVIEAARNFGSVVELAYTDPRSKIFIDDAKAFFSAHNKKYDIIVSEPSNPWVSGVAGLFSEEFYRIMGRHLTENGVFCQWLQLYEIDMDMVVSVLKALSANFKDYTIYAANNADMIIIAKNGKAIGEPGPAIFSRPEMARILKRIQIEGIQDITLHQVGDKKIFSAFLESFPVQANSDYYPVLDQNAAINRFLNSSATELIDLAHRPLPVSDLLTMSGPSWEHTVINPSSLFSKSLDAFAATAFRDYYLSGRFSAGYEDIPKQITNQAVRLKELFYQDCGAASQERISLLYDVVGLRMIPFLRPNELDRVWNKLESGACFESLTPRDRQWIGLLKAVGQRDAGTMANSATALLAKERNLQKGPMSYLVASGMLGCVIQGDRERSLSLWRRYRSDIYGTARPSVFFRLLVALSTKKT